MTYVHAELMSDTGRPQTSAGHVITLSEEPCPGQSTATALNPSFPSISHVSLTKHAWLIGNQ